MTYFACFCVYSVLRTAQSILSYLAFLGADVSASVPFCSAQFIATYWLHLYCSVWANKWWWWWLTTVANTSAGKHHFVCKIM